MSEATAETTCWHGDLAEYTGNTEKMHGGLFYEIRLIEGHLKGQAKWTMREPKTPTGEEK